MREKQKESLKKDEKKEIEKEIEKERKITSGRTRLQPNGTILKIDGKRLTHGRAHAPRYE